MSDRHEPAFPGVRSDLSPGMTLRDWFAGRVAAALCSATDQGGLWTAPIDDESAEIVAQRAYAVADAMLEARKGKANG